MRFSERTLRKMQRRGAVVERMTPEPEPQPAPAAAPGPMKFLFDVTRDDGGRIKSITATPVERDREE